MINPKKLLHLAAYSVSLPSLAVSPSVAKATVYMPSSIAAERLGNARDVVLSEAKDLLVTPPSPDPSQPDR